MPTEKDLEFKDYSKTVTPPFVIYADFESVLLADDQHFQKHLPVSAGLLLVNDFTNLSKYMQFVGNDCIYEFLKEIENISKNEVYPYYQQNGKRNMRITPAQQMEFNTSTNCYLCKKELIVPVRDHDHFTGEYKGAAC